MLRHRFINPMFTKETGNHGLFVVMFPKLLLSSISHLGQMIEYTHSCIKIDYTTTPGKQ